MFIDILKYHICNYFLFNRVSVRVGEWDINTEKDCIMSDLSACAPPVQDIKVESYKVHEMYNDTLEVNDIMMIKLEHPVKYTRNIQTICLPTNENEIISKTVDLQHLIVTGWSRKSDILLFIQMNYVPLEECKERLIEDGIKTKLYESNICAKKENLEDPCLGIDITNI